MTIVIIRKMMNNDDDDDDDDKADADWVGTTWHNTWSWYWAKPSRIVSLWMKEFQCIGLSWSSPLNRVYGCWSLLIRIVYNNLKNSGKVFFTADSRSTLLLSNGSASVELSCSLWAFNTSCAVDTRTHTHIQASTHVRGFLFEGPVPSRFSASILGFWHTHLLRVQKLQIPILSPWLYISHDFTKLFRQERFYREEKKVFSRSQHVSCRFLLGGNHWKSCPTQFTEALGPAYRNRRTGLLVSANKMLGRIYRSFWQLILGSELLWHRRSARTSAWHQLVSEILCFGGWISRKHSVKRYFNIISRSFLMYVQISSSQKFPPCRKIKKSLKQSVLTENPLGWRHTGCCLMVTPPIGQASKC